MCSFCLLERFFYLCKFNEHLKKKKYLENNIIPYTIIFVLFKLKKRIFDTLLSVLHPAKKKVEITVKYQKNGSLEEHRFTYSIIVLIIHAVLTKHYKK